jgi:hypothetical protein
VTKRRTALYDRPCRRCRERMHGDLISARVAI